MLALLRSRLGLYGGLVLAVVAITLMAIVTYRVYVTAVASTPQKAVQLYLDTINKGDMMMLYDMTLNASSQTQAEFAMMIGSLFKDKRLSTDGSAPEQIGKQGNLYYFRVKARLATSDGSYRQTPLLLEATQEGKSWRVNIFVPPVAVPSR